MGLFSFWVREISFGCFFYALEGENWMTEMPENWEITDRHERTDPEIPWSSFAFFHRKYNYQLLDYLLCSRLTFSLPLNSAQVWNTTLLIPILLPVYKASNTIWTSSQMLHLCLKKLTPSFNQDCIHIRKCLMPSMREHYNTDGIRISTTERYYFFLHHLPHYSTSFGCFFCAFMGENWKCGMRKKLGGWWHLFQ